MDPLLKAINDFMQHVSGAFREGAMVRGALIMPTIRADAHHHLYHYPTAVDLITSCVVQNLYRVITKNKNARDGYSVVARPDTSCAHSP